MSAWASPGPDRPWLRGFRPDLLNLVQAADFDHRLAGLNQHAQSAGLVTGRGRPLHFVPQSALPAGLAYEAFVAQTGGVPTRDHPHDALNALIWLHSPQAKAALNALQAQVLARAERPESSLGAAGARGPLRDWATHWDENGALLICAPGQADQLQDRLARHDWQALFVEDQAGWGRGWRCQPFGHALLEKLAQPRKAITAHVLVMPLTDPQPEPSLDWPQVDLLLARRLWALVALANTDPLAAAARLRGELRLRPLPVMGIPGWSPTPQDHAFYADVRVFRPAPRYTGQDREGWAVAADSSGEEGPDSTGKGDG